MGKEVNFTMGEIWFTDGSRENLALEQNFSSMIPHIASMKKQNFDDSGIFNPHNPKHGICMNTRKPAAQIDSISQLP